MVRALVLLLCLFGISATRATAQSVGDKETGLAAVYTDGLHGHVTASGQLYDKAKLTAAHKTLPYGTKINGDQPEEQPKCGPAGERSRSSPIHTHPGYFASGGRASRIQPPRDARSQPGGDRGWRREDHEASAALGAKLRAS